MYLPTTETRAVQSDYRAPSVTIVVTTKNNQDTIRDCIQSLLNMNYPKSKVTILVIDASSNNLTLDTLRTMNVKVIKYNGNAPSAYNFALRDVKTDFVGFVDGDAIVDPEWLSQIISKIDNPDIVGGAGPIHTWNRQRIIPRCVGYELESRYNNPKNVVRSSTTNLVLTTTAIGEVGGFDESLDTGYDGDIGYRLGKAGYRILFVPQASVYHSHRPTLRSYFKQQYVYARNDIRLYHKNSGLILNDNVTSRWMVVQPPILVLFGTLGIASLLVSWFRGAVAPLLSEMIVISFFVTGLAITLLYFAASIKMAIRVREPIATPVLFSIFVTRAVAWTLGGIIGIFDRFRFAKRTLE